MTRDEHDPATATPAADDELHTAVVDGFTHGGEGVVRIDGKAVFVPGALPGERVRVRVVERHRRWSRAALVEVVDAAVGRVEPPCPLATDCGGCDLQHVDPAHQVRLKARVVREQLERIGHVTDPPVLPGRSVGPALGYRMHARMTADDDGRLGFHRRGSDEVVPVPHCPVLTPAAQALRELVGDDTGAAEVSLCADGVGLTATAAGPTATHDGATSAGAIVLLPGPGSLELPGGAPDLLLEQPDGSTAAIRGDGVLRVPVRDVVHELPAGSFFQVSVEAAAALVDEVLDALGDVTGAVAWDLYAGVGLLSVPLALAGADVVAVEGDDEALAAARRTAVAHDTAVRTVTADVRDWLARGVAEGIDLPDVVVLDPPRTGAGADAMADLATLGPPRVVYVACDPAALARDTRALLDGGYALRLVQPLDLFPMTHHVEAVALFTR